MKGEELAGVKMLLAAPHSKLRLPDDQTDRMLLAVRTPGLHVLAHSRGRMPDSRVEEDARRRKEWTPRP